MQHKIVSQSEWLNARKTLLAKEKEFSKARDALSAARRTLPELVLGRSAAKSITRGYLYGAVCPFTWSCSSLTSVDDGA